MVLTNRELAERIVRNAPELLKILPQWVMWKYQTIEGKPKPKKPPFQISGRAAKVDAPETWSSYLEVINMLDTSSNYEGVGFMLERGIVAIDLDDCLMEVEGGRRMNDAARRIYNLARSYTEVSPSGKGLHIFLRGNLPEVDGKPLDGMRYGKSEMYEAKRYITVTGERVGKAHEIREDQEAINQIYELLKAPERDPQGAQPERRSYSLTSGDEEVLSKARNARNGAKFTRLYQGDFIGYPSPSEAHLALVAMLVYWTNGKEDQIERLFKSSDMYLLYEEVQSKWDSKHSSDGRTYGQKTMRLAGDTTQQY